MCEVTGENMDQNRVESEDVSFCGSVFESFKSIRVYAACLWELPLQKVLQMVSAVDT